MDYRIKGFIIENGEYKVAWLYTSATSGNILPSSDNVRRTLMLPSTDSLIESWENFKN